MPYHTGETPTGDCTISIDIPDCEALRWAIRGAISQLIYAHNWEKVGAGTIDEYTEAMRDALDSWDWRCRGP